MPADRIPTGQFVSPSFDRFGLGLFANRFPKNLGAVRLAVSGDVEHAIEVGAQLQALPRVEQISDFHCVTTWSVLDLRWSGYRFRDFYEQIVLPMAQPKSNATFVVLKGQDGFRTCMQLSDLLAENVLLADTLNGAPLNIAHGAPLRLIAPAHYGYKNMKHLAAIEFWTDSRNYKFPSPYPGLMDHPRARVEFEERTRLVPAWLIRYLYRALIPWARRKSAQALEKYEQSSRENPES